MSLDTPAKRLKWAREQQGLYASPTDAARAYGWPVSTYLGHENGDRNPSRDAAKRYARTYHVRWEWLLEGDGLPTAKAPGIVRLVGEVSTGSQVRLYPEDKIKDSGEMPPHASVFTVAVEVRGGSMRGIADDGWLIFFEDLKRPPTAELVGKLCVVELDDGRVFVRVLQPGRKKGRYDLESMTEATMRDQRVVWAAQVSWIKPR